MTEQLKQFLHNNKNSLEEDDFRTLYKNWSKYIDSDDVSDLTDVFLEVGIDPLNYLPEVPAKYAYYSKLLTKLIIPSHIDRILPFAFMGCDNLKEVILPTSIKIIGYFAFDRVTGCRFIYRDTSSNFLELNMYYNSFSPSAEIQCTDTTKTFSELTADIWDWDWMKV